MVEFLFQIPKLYAQITLIGEGLSQKKRFFCMEIDKEWKPTSKAPLPAARKRPSRSSAHRSWKEDEYEFLDDDDHPQMGRVVPLLLTVHTCPLFCVS